MDIGEPQANHQSQMDLNIQGNNGNMVGTTVITHGQHNGFKADKFIVKG